MTRDELIAEIVCIIEDGCDPHHEAPTLDMAEKVLTAIESVIPVSGILSGERVAVPNFVYVGSYLADKLRRGETVDLGNGVTLALSTGAVTFASAK